MGMFSDKLSMWKVILGSGEGEIQWLFSILEMGKNKITKNKMHWIGL